MMFRTWFCQATLADGRLGSTSPRSRIITTKCRRPTEKSGTFSRFLGQTVGQTPNPRGSMTTLIVAAIFSLFQATGNPARPTQAGQQQPRKALIESAVTSLPAQVATRSSAVEQRIQRIQDHIISPVIGRSAVEGPSMAAHM